MTQQIPATLGSKVTTRSYGWNEMVERAWGSEFRAPDHAIYEFSSGRKFDSTDKYQTGLYGVKGDTLLVLDGQPYPDMRDGIHAAVGVALGAANGGFGAYGEVLADPRT